MVASRLHKVCDIWFLGRSDCLNVGWVVGVMLSMLSVMSGRGGSDCLRWAGTMASMVSGLGRPDCGSGYGLYGVWSGKA